MGVVRGIQRNAGAVAGHGLPVHALGGPGRAVPARVPEVVPTRVDVAQAGLVRGIERDGAEVSLARLEFELLAFLLKNKDRVLKRVEILEAVWKYPSEVETRTLDKHVETLRRKLGDAGKQLKTIHGVSYRFFDAEPTTA